MPKRLLDADMDAALAAGLPPRSEDFIEDEKWHDAQDEWLEAWQPGVKLPGPDSVERRTKWNVLTKKHKSHYEAAGRRPTPNMLPSHLSLATSVDVPASTDSEWLDSLRRRCRQLSIDWSVSDTIHTLETRVMHCVDMPAVSVPEALALPPRQPVPDAAPAEHEHSSPAEAAEGRGGLLRQGTHRK